MMSSAPRPRLRPRHADPSPFPTPGLKMTGTECVQGMAAGLYQELFAAVVSLVNR